MLPFMALFMLGAALSAFIRNQNTRIGVTALFLFLFAVVYSPGFRDRGQPAVASAGAAGEQSRAGRAVGRLPVVMEGFVAAQ